MSRKDDLQFLTTDLEYSDETPQQSAPLFPDEADDTFVGKLGLLKEAATRASRCSTCCSRAWR